MLSNALRSISGERTAVSMVRQLVENDDLVSNRK